MVEMKLYIENEHGNIREIKEIQTLGEGELLILSSSVILKKTEIEVLEKELSEKTNKSVVILDPRLSVIGVYK